MHAQVLLLDEPTSALSHAETDRLFRVLDRLRRQGVAIVFVSHRLAEVFEIADRVSILRDGRLVASYPRNAIDHDLAVRSMVGRVLSDLYPERAGTPGPTRLEARGLRSGPVGPVDLALHAGEIIGLAGLQGSGRSRLARALGGVERYDGEVRIDGRPVRLRGPWSAARHGIVFVPADRAGEGLFPRMTVGQNLVAMALAAVSRLGIVRPRAERALVARLLRDFGIRASGPGQLASRLSGGNQQKTMLARSLAVAPRVLVVDEPTQGIDVGARAEIHQLLRRLASDRVAVLMVSSDLPEILGMCDRVAVMAGGTVQKVLPGVATTEERVMALAVGARDRTGGAGHA
jgi:ribose transport system ATP-binding protein